MPDLDLKLTDNDLGFDSDGELETVDGSDLATQYAGVTLRTAKREWPWDQAFGLEYALILRRDHDKGQISAHIRATLRSVPDINRVFGVELEFDPVERRLTGTAWADTVYSPLETIPLFFG